MRFDIPPANPTGKSFQVEEGLLDSLWTDVLATVQPFSPPSTLVPSSLPWLLAIEGYYPKQNHVMAAITWCANAEEIMLMAKQESPLKSVHTALRGVYDVSLRYFEQMLRKLAKAESASEIFSYFISRKFDGYSKDTIAILERVAEEERVPLRAVNGLPSSVPVPGAGAQHLNAGEG